ncbi:hypothetical protein PsorP6_008736 [Peronosclerospora sorghi]|uniref:Uncharacterized protein n=1 Tax=Peronosclerospora sorghi TaxID=230839 RepID=A0ACC0VZ89_9STRA|nr:hypothetical protein PsorP6_008736 [Peronosclerospora sorghi]
MMIMEFLSLPRAWVYQDYSHKSSILQRKQSHLSESAFVPTTLLEKYSWSSSLVTVCLNTSLPIMYTQVELVFFFFMPVAALIFSIDKNETAFSRKIILRHLNIVASLESQKGGHKRIRGNNQNLWR